MKTIINNPYKRGTKEYKAYKKGFKAGYSYYIDTELERIRGELEAIKIKQKLADIIRNINNNTPLNIWK